MAPGKMLKADARELRSDEAQEIFPESHELHEKFFGFALGGREEITRIPELHGIRREFLQKTCV